MYCEFIHLNRIIIYIGSTLFFKLLSGSKISPYCFIFFETFQTTVKLNRIMGIWDTLLFSVHFISRKCFYQFSSSIFQFLQRVERSDKLIKVTEKIFIHIYKWILEWNFLSSLSIINEQFFITEIYFLLWWGYLPRNNVFLFPSSSDETVEEKKKKVSFLPK